MRVGRGTDYTSLKLENAQLRAEVAQLEAEGKQQRRRIEELELAGQMSYELALRVRQLEKEIETLKGKLELATRAAKRQAAPFARIRCARRRRRPGQKVGHRPAHRPYPERIDQELWAPLKQCPDCGGSLDSIGEHEHVEVDIPEVRAFTRRFHTQSGYCRSCRRRVRSRHPEQTSSGTGKAGIHLGPRVIALTADLKHRVGVPYRKVMDLLQVAFQFPVSPGGLWRAVARLADKSTPSYLALVESLRQSTVVAADETGWRIGRRMAWLWVFATSEITVYVIDEKRNASVPEAVLGDFRGILTCDGWQGYQSLPYQRAQCARHLLRHCEEILEVANGPALPFGYRRKSIERFPLAIKKLLLRAIRLKQQHEQMEPTRYQAAGKALREQLAKLIRAPGPFPGNQRMARHFQRHEPELLVFLSHPEVAASNNLAEREIRPAVVIRKISAGSRSSYGAYVHQVLASLSQTAHRNGCRFLEIAPLLLKSPQPALVPLPLLNPGNSLKGDSDALLRPSWGRPSGRAGKINSQTPQPKPRRIHRHSQRHRSARRRSGRLARSSAPSGPSPP